MDMVALGVIRGRNFISLEIVGRSPIIFDRSDFRVAYGFVNLAITRRRIAYT